MKKTISFLYAILTILGIGLLLFNNLLGPASSSDREIFKIYQLFYIITPLSIWLINIKIKSDDSKFTKTFRISTLLTFIFPFIAAPIVQFQLIPREVIILLFIVLLITTIITGIICTIRDSKKVN